MKNKIECNSNGSGNMKSLNVIVTDTVIAEAIVIVVIAAVKR